MLLGKADAKIKPENPICDQKTRFYKIKTVELEID